MFAEKNYQIIKLAYLNDTEYADRNYYISFDDVTYSSRIDMFDNINK